ncbi:hypothetical protein F2Q68_00041391 [Brassica cretica]|uniref:Uncharacterized protein n=2 Tax=Brassica cretica TaxID=69181 RepID=A0ABQ7AC03_BRACR|nr:hypothetical protein F2Q68_00041391 [Brassica cretica]KAF3495199.1 hypothetical protein DY000_02055934 [Brassica cretica]
MPCLYITTNVNMEGVDTDPFYLEVTKAVASIAGRPQNLVMVVLKGSIEIVFGGNKEAAAYAEIVSMGGITKQVKRLSQPLVLFYTLIFLLILLVLS